METKQAPSSSKFDRAYAGGVSLTATWGHPPASRPEAGLDLPVGASVGRFTILEEIGCGGMSRIFAAYDPQLDRKVALKLLRTDRTSQQERILREAKALARLGHPNVVTIYEVGLYRRRLFLAMEHVPGVSLRRWLREEELTVPRILDAFEQAGRGLAAAHREGLVHRDFKPGNVMVRPDGRVQVLDFGLVRRDPKDRVVSEAELGTRSVDVAFSDHEPSRSDRGAGTPGYIAPEQERGEEVGPAADQYSFCVALERALAGCQSTGLPASLRRAFRRGQREDPGDRFGTMAELLRELRKSPRARRRRALSAAALIVLSGTWMLTTRSRLEEPLEESGLREALASLEASRGADNLEVGASYLQLGYVELNAGREDQALEYFQKAAAIYEEKLAPEDPRRVHAARFVCGAYLQLGRLTDALSCNQEILDSLGPRARKTPLFALVTFNRGELWYLGSDSRAALSHFRRALDLWSSLPDSEARRVLVATGLGGTGKALLELGRPSEAILDLEQSVAILSALDTEHVLLAESRMNLARALAIVGREPQRALDLARAAATALSAAGPLAEGRFARARAWLAMHEPVTELE